MFFLVADAAIVTIHPACSVHYDHLCLGSWHPFFVFDLESHKIDTINLTTMTTMSIIAIMLIRFGIPLDWYYKPEIWYIILQHSISYMIDTIKLRITLTLSNILSMPHRTYMTYLSYIIRQWRLSPIFLIVYHPYFTWYPKHKYLSLNLAWQKRYRKQQNAII